MEALSVLPVLTFFHYWFFYFNGTCNEIEISFIKSGFFLFPCFCISGEVMTVETMTGRILSQGVQVSKTVLPPCPWK